MDMTEQAGSYLARYRQRIDANARAWLAFVRTEQDPKRLAEEQDNLVKAARQALREPTAWEAAIDLMEALWPYLEARGQWQVLAELLEAALGVSQQAGWLGREVDLRQYLGRGVRGDERADGHGLGLAIVSEVVSAYGGAIDFTTSELGGARVTVRFPAS